MSTDARAAPRRPAARRQRLLRRRRVRRHVRPAQSQIEPLAARGRPPRQAPSCGRWSTSRSCWPAPSSASRSARLGLGVVAEPALAHLLEVPLHALGRQPRASTHPIAFVVALALVVYLHVVLGEMVPEEPRRRRTGPRGPAVRPAAGLGRPRRAPVIAALNWIANHALRLVGVEPKDEVASAFTAEEVQSIVERSRREGLLDDEQGLLSRRARVLATGPRATSWSATGALVTVARRQHARGRRAAGRPDRLQPVPRGRRRRGADGLPAPQGRPVRRRARALACRCRRGACGRWRWSAAGRGRGRARGHAAVRRPPGAGRRGRRDRRRRVPRGHPRGARRARCATRCSATSCPDRWSGCTDHVRCIGVSHRVSPGMSTSRTGRVSRGLEARRRAVMVS